MKSSILNRPIVDKRRRSKVWRCIAPLAGVYVIATLALLMSSSASADQVLTDLVHRLQNKYETMDTLQANFSQNYQSKRFSGGGITETGVVYLRKGGLMKWEYQKPEKKIFVSDGLFYFYYVPADKQVVKSPVDNQNQQSPALFLAGRGNFAKDFKAAWADPRPGSRLINLTPVRPQPDFEHLIVEVDPARYLVLRLLVVDSYENRTEYKFTNIKENPTLPKNFFVFQAPSGADVIFQQRDADQN
jgi:outer membrane lipoprotein carrier protein